jgi:hypothetical protein
LLEMFKQGAERGWGKLRSPPAGTKCVGKCVLCYNGFHYLNRASITRRSLQLPEGKRGEFKLQ